MPPDKTRQDPITGVVENNIRKLRFEADEMTQQELADLIGATRQTIHAIEASKYAPSLELAFKVAAAFDRPIQEVFSYTRHDKH
ncbi:MAG: helix-turn-helix transcriptional regulator [Rhodothermales bacterium]|nr:helix-turn-helix transcriptional regulator [Rhodothermales bacterium]